MHAPPGWPSVLEILEDQEARRACRIRTTGNAHHGEKSDDSVFHTGDLSEG